MKMREFSRGNGFQEPIKKSGITNPTQDFFDTNHGMQTKEEKPYRRLGQL
jgi:hypothetical protein